MSRSYKKTPCASNGNDKFFKRKFNKRLRQKLKNSEEEIQNGEFKKHNNSWDINEYKYRYTWEDYWNFTFACWVLYDRDRGIPFPDEKKEKAKWRKWYKGK